jgi:hypothetical protein
VAISLSAFTLAYLSLAVPLQLSQRLRPIPAGKQRSIILVELYALTWTFLIGTTILTRLANIAGLYWVPLWNGSLLVAIALGVLERPWGASQVDPVDSHQEGVEVSETTPLLQQHDSSTDSVVLEERTQDEAPFWWIFQFLFSATAPVVNLASIFAIWICAMPQTIPDGGSVGIGMGSLPLALQC